MGVIYMGPYSDLIDTYRHEGYAARAMPDGTLTGSWGGDIPDDAHIGFRAACDCGWIGDTLHPSGDYDSPGYQAAEQEWDTAHIQPLIEQAKRSWRDWARGVGSRLAYFAGVAQDGTAPGKWADVLQGLTEIGRDIETRRRVANELATEREGREDDD